MRAIILAGGKGTRLKPFTNTIPKPLVPIGDMPILEVILRQLKRAGFTDITLAVSHLARLIESFFGDGTEYSLRLNYSTEDRILGTAGPLKQITDLPENFLVMNGDLLTTLDFSDLYTFHMKNGCTATIGSFKKEIKIDLGVLECSDGIFSNYIEKPTYQFTVSMGIYILNREVIEFIPAGEKYDMPNLILDLQKSGKKVMVYSSDYDWLDIGRIDDYETAVELFEKQRDRYLPK